MMYYFSLTVLLNDSMKDRQLMNKQITMSEYKNSIPNY